MSNFVAKTLGGQLPGEPPSLTRHLRKYATGRKTPTPRYITRETRQQPKIYKAGVTSNP